MAKIKTLEEALEALAKSETEKAELVEVVKDLKTKLENTSKALDVQNQVLEHNGKKYQVTCKSFHYNGEKHLAETLVDKPEIVSELVEKQAGYLVEVQ